jgi:hypothetical protein
MCIFIFPVPEVSETACPSGFFMPRAKPGHFPYFIRRNANWLYPGEVTSRLKSWLSLKIRSSSENRTHKDKMTIKCREMQFKFRACTEILIAVPTAWLNEMAKKIHSWRGPVSTPQGPELHLDVFTPQVLELLL